MTPRLPHMTRVRAAVLAGLICAMAAVAPRPAGAAPGGSCSVTFSADAALTAPGSTPVGSATVTCSSLAGQGPEVDGSVPLDVSSFPGAASWVALQYVGTPPPMALVFFVDSYSADNGSPPYAVLPSSFSCTIGGGGAAWFGAVGSASAPGGPNKCAVMVTPASAADGVYWPALGGLGTFDTSYNAGPGYNGTPWGSASLVPPGGSGGGGGSGSDPVAAAFTTSGDQLASYVSDGAGVAAALVLLGLGVLIFVRYTRKAGRAS